jgi:PAS domain S-box-containing protein
MKDGSKDHPGTSRGSHAAPPSRRSVACPRRETDPRPPSAFRRYGAAVLSVVVAALIRLELHNILNENAPLLLFVLAVMFSAWYGGLGPGLFATILAAAAGSYLFLEPAGQVLSIAHPHDVLRLILFCVIGVVISFLNHTLKKEVVERRRAEQASKAQAQALIEVIERLAKEHRLERLQELVLETTVNQLAASGGALWSYNEDTDVFRVELVFQNGRTMTPEAAGHPLAGEEISSRDLPGWGELKNRYLAAECVQFPDLESDTRLSERMRAGLLQMGTKSLLVIPLLLQGRFVGSVVVRTLHPKTYSSHEIQLAHSLANQATLAMQLTRLAEQAQQTALMQERERAAQERAEELEERVRERTAELQDATETLRRQAELLDISHDALIVWELGGGILSWNRGAENLYGWQHSEVMGKVTHDLLRSRHPESVEAMEGALVSKGYWDGELVHTTRDGREILIDSRHIVTQTDDGRQLVLEMNRDVTSRRQAEAALRRQAELLDISHDALIVWELGGGILSWNRGAEDLYGWNRSEVEGKVSHDLLRTRHPQSIAALQAQLASEGRWDGELIHTTRDGRQIAVESRFVVFETDEGRRLVLETNRDITARKEAEEALRASETRYRELNEALEQRVRERTAELDRTIEALHGEMAEREQAERSSKAQTRALTRVLEQLTREQRFEELPGIVLAAIVDQLEAAGGSLWRYDEASDGFEELLDFGSERGVVADASDHLSSPLRLDARKDREWERIKAGFLRGECLVIPDPLDYPALEPKVGAELAESRIRTTLVAPMLLQGHLLGLLSLRSTREEKYNSHDFTLALALAHQATLAVQMSRLGEQARKTAMLDERNRMAQVIHDSLAQSFMGILLQLGAAERLLTQDLNKGRTHLQSALDLARDGMAEARRSAHALRPSALETGDLAAALERMTEQLSADQKIRFQLHGTPRPLPPHIADPLFRIGQEALTNALRHAQASLIGIELTFAPEAVRLCVSDDGQGMGLDSPAREAGLGLTGMQERAAAIGAVLDVTSRPGQGTKVDVTWRYPPGESSEGTLAEQDADVAITKVKE